MDTFDPRTAMTILMTPDLVNFGGNVHGGHVLKYLDQVAYACATRYCGQYVVTLSVDQVVFKQPIHVGELVTLQAQVNYTGRTSLEIGIEVYAEDPRARSARHVMTSFFTMVAVDATGKPAAVPTLVLETDDDRRRHAAALRRRDQRLKAAEDAKTG